MRVLRILTRCNVGGPGRQALALWQEDAGAGLQTLLAFGRCATGEVELDMSAVPELEVSAVDGSSRGCLRLARLGRGMGLRGAAAAVAELRALIRRFAPDVVHTHTSQAGWYGRRAAWAEGVPVTAHTFHGLVLRDYYPEPVSWWLRGRERRLALRTDLLFAVSPSCVEELAELRIGGGRVAVLPPALELAEIAAADRVAARQRLALDEEAFGLGFVGRLAPVKQPELFAAVLRACPDVQGRMLGDGPLAETLRLPDNLRRLGAVQDPARYLAGLDALLICSRREGLPLVAVEAFAAGVPVLGFDVPGIRDALQSWGAGILVPPDQGVPGLVAALARLRDEPGLATGLRQRAAAGLGRFAPAAVAEELARCYQRAAGGKLG